jgi:hypothetical protein
MEKYRKQKSSAPEGEHLGVWLNSIPVSAIMRSSH